MTPDDREQADELINELQHRIDILLKRGDDCLEKNVKEVDVAISYGESPRITINDGLSQSFITWEAGRYRVTYKGGRVLEITGAQVDMIDVQGLSKAMNGIRRRMILDDLAEL